jgi:Abortive infection C-terminus
VRDSLLAWGPRDRLTNAFAKEGLGYSRGGYIHGANLIGPSKSLRERLESNGMRTVETEFKRAYDSIESDPPQAVTAACSILEALCKNYLEIEKEEGPNKQVLGSLFPQVMTHLGLSPKDIVDDDLKQILSGIYSIATGVAALRTHAGSAHGRSDKKSYKMGPRHARLAVHSAHTLTMFILETWEARNK